MAPDSPPGPGLANPGRGLPAVCRGMTADVCPACGRSRKLSPAAPGFTELDGLRACWPCGIYIRAAAVLSVVTELPMPDAEWLCELARRMAAGDREGTGRLWDALEVQRP
jgi:hypothetical protein